MPNYIDDIGLVHFWHNIKNYVDDGTSELLAKTSQDIIAIMGDMIEELGSIPRTFGGKAYSVQGIEYANGYLYVGYSLRAVDCCIAKINPSTLEVVTYKEPGIYVHFNSLCHFDGYLYTVSPETTTIGGVEACYITVFDADTLEIVRSVGVGTATHMKNLCIAPYGTDNVPFIQSYIARNGFVNYMSYGNADGEMVTQSVTRHRYTPNAASIADSCCLVNLTGGNTGSVFAHVLSNYNSTKQALNGIMFTDMSGAPCAFAQLPPSYDTEFEGITTYGSNNVLLMCDVHGILYEINFGNINSMVAKYGQSYNDEMYLPNAATSITNKLKVGFVTNSTNIIRRFCLAGPSIRITTADLANIFGVTQGNFIANGGATLETITVTGMRFYSNSAAAFICCTYKLDESLPSQRVYNLSKIRAQPILGNDSGVSIDDVERLTDEELALRLTNTVFLTAHCSLQLENSPRDYDEILWFKGLF